MAAVNTVFKCTLPLYKREFINERSPYFYQCDRCYNQTGVTRCDCVTFLGEANLSSIKSNSSVPVAVAVPVAVPVAVKEEPHPKCINDEENNGGKRCSGCCICDKYRFIGRPCANCDIYEVPGYPPYGYRL